MGYKQDGCSNRFLLIFKIDLNTLQSMTFYGNHFTLKAFHKDWLLDLDLSQCTLFPLEDVINAHSLIRMIYADDTQTYVILGEIERPSLFQIMKNASQGYIFFRKC